MKKILPLISCLALLPFSNAAETAKPASVPAAAPIPGIDPAATAVWSEHARGMGDRRSGRDEVDFNLVTGKAFEFFEKFPTERRVGGILFNLASFGGWLKEDPRAGEKRAAWEQHLKQSVAEVLANKQWPDNIWAGLHWVQLRNEIDLQADAGKVDLPALRRIVDATVARTPASPYRVFMENDYLEQLRLHEPASVEAFLTTLAQSDVSDLAAIGKGQLAIEELKRKPMELSFTAVDGTPVDLAQLRGKVVLVDCWATWCVPCIKELPNIKAALAKWGDKGFVVVGISFDRLPDRQKLVNFIAKENLNWPHWFNEKGGQNPFGKQYNIRSIPATFLLGRDGRLVTTQTHGAQLDAALTKLLAN